MKAHPALFEREGEEGVEPKNEALLFQSAVDIHSQNAHKTLFQSTVDIQVQNTHRTHTQNCKGSHSGHLFIDDTFDSKCLHPNEIGIFFHHISSFDGVCIVLYCPQ